VPTPELGGSGVNGGFARDPGVVSGRFCKVAVSDLGSQYVEDWQAELNYPNLPGAWRPEVV
jgi:hypothetical protein